MKRHFVETDSLNDYFAPIGARLQDLHIGQNLYTQALFLLKSSEVHFTRHRLAERRLLRAQAANDPIGVAYENSVIHALLYEIADTIYQVVALLDFDQLDLSASMDGCGLAGECAAEVVLALSALDRQCAGLLELERKHSVNIDFKTAIDEKEGISFEKHRHWQDFVAGSVAKSFRSYFALAQTAVRTRLSQRPKFWRDQMVGQYLNRKGHESLNEILGRLDAAAFGHQH